MRWLKYYKFIGLAVICAILRERAVTLERLEILRETGRRVHNCMVLFGIVKVIPCTVRS